MVSGQIPLDYIASYYVSTTNMKIQQFNYVILNTGKFVNQLNTAIIHMCQNTEFAIIRSLDVNLIKVYGRNFQFSVDCEKETRAC